MKSLLAKFSNHVIHRKELALINAGTRGQCHFGCWSNYDENTFEGRNKIDNCINECDGIYDQLEGVH